MDQKPYFPMFTDLSEKKVTVVGAGIIAKRRVRTLIQFTDHVTVIAPEVNRELLDLEKEGRIRILRKHFEQADIFGADVVIAATSDAKTNNDVYANCKCLGITVNVCSDRTKCDFFFPGVVQKENVVVGVTASGRDHKLARKVTKKIRELIETL